MKSKRGESGPVLGIDTCGPSSTLALGGTEPDSGIDPNIDPDPGVDPGPGVDRLTISAQHMLPPRTAGTHLTVALRELFGPNGPAGLRAIVVVRGPGSFTGMRIGLSAAKALSEATGTPLMAVSRLAVLARRSGAQAVALDAGRGRVYLRLATGEERLTSVEDTHAALAPKRHGGEYAGPDIDLAVCGARVAALFPRARVVAEPTAADALQYGWARIEAGDWDDPVTLDALYLWRPEEMLAQPVRAE